MKTVNQVWKMDSKELTDHLPELMITSKGKFPSNVLIYLFKASLKYIYLKLLLWRHNCPLLGRHDITSQPMHLSLWSIRSICLNGKQQSSQVKPRPLSIQPKQFITLGILNSKHFVRLRGIKIQMLFTFRANFSKDVDEILALFLHI